MVNSEGMRWTGHVECMGKIEISIVFGGNSRSKKAIRKTKT
jgi:hypothetical protein